MFIFTKKKKVAIFDEIVRLLLRYIKSKLIGKPQYSAIYKQVIDILDSDLSGVELSRVISPGHQKTFVTPPNSLKLFHETTMTFLWTSLIDKWLYIVGVNSVKDLSMLIHEYIKLLLEGDYHDIKMVSPNLLECKRDGDIYYVYLGKFLQTKTGEENVSYRMVIRKTDIEERTNIIDCTKLS